MTITSKHASTHVTEESLAKIVHDFKTPINIILSSTTLLRLKTISLAKSQSDISRYLHYIEQNCQRLLRLVNIFLAKSHPQLDIPELMTSQCDMEQFLLSFLSDLIPHIRQQDLEFRYHSLFDGPCILYFDGDQLDRILMNLFSNAIKHTSRGGMILLSAGADDDYIYISVADDGEGIPPEELPHIFKPFRTGASELTKRSNSTGLGLSIVKDLVELHGGTVSVSSTPGFGTCFIFTISRHLPHTMINPRDELPTAL